MTIDLLNVLMGFALIKQHLFWSKIVKAENEWKWKENVYKKPAEELQDIRSG